MELQRFFLFVVLIYMEHWFRAPSAASRNCKVTMTLTAKLQNWLLKSLWYLTEDLVGLAFCDDVPDERKLAMLSALQKPARKQTVKRLEAQNIAGKIGNMELDDFLRRDPENCLKSSQLTLHS